MNWQLPLPFLKNIVKFAPKNWQASNQLIYEDVRAVWCRRNDPHNNRLKFFMIFGFLGSISAGHFETIIAHCSYTISKTINGRRFLRGVVMLWCYSHTNKVCWLEFVYTYITWGRKNFSYVCPIKIVLKKFPSLFKWSVPVHEGIQGRRNRFLPW